MGQSTVLVCLCPSEVLSLPQLVSLSLKAFIVKGILLKLSSSADHVMLLWIIGLIGNTLGSALISCITFTNAVPQGAEFLSANDCGMALTLCGLWACGFVTPMVGTLWACCFHPCSWAKSGGHSFEKLNLYGKK